MLEKKNIECLRSEFTICNPFTSSIAYRKRERNGIITIFQYSSRINQKEISKMPNTGNNFKINYNERNNVRVGV